MQSSSSSTTHAPNGISRRSHRGKYYASIAHVTVAWRGPRRPQGKPGTERNRREHIPASRTRRVAGPQLSEDACAPSRTGGGSPTKSSTPHATPPRHVKHAPGPVADAVPSRPSSFDAAPPIRDPSRRRPYAEVGGRAGRERHGAEVHARSGGEGRRAAFRSKPCGPAAGSCCVESDPGQAGGRESAGTGGPGRGGVAVGGRSTR